MQGYALDGTDEHLPPLPEPPEGARPPTPTWRDDVVSRLEAIGTWMTTVENDRTVLEPVGSGFFIQVFADYADLERVRDPDSSVDGPAQAMILDAFRVCPAVLHWPVGNGEWWLIDDLDRLAGFLET